MKGMYILYFKFGLILLFMAGLSSASEDPKSVFKEFLQIQTEMKILQNSVRYLEFSVARLNYEKENTLSAVTRELLPELKEISKIIKKKSDNKCSQIKGGCLNGNCDVSKVDDSPKGCQNMTCEANPECPIGYTPILSKCFKIIEDEFNWEDSKKECTKDGGTLAIVNNCKLMNPLSTFFRNLKLNFTSHIIWIGASDIEKEGHWRWIDGSKVELGVVGLWGAESIDVLQPIGGLGENCAEMHPTDQYYIHDNICYKNGKPLCEAKPLSVEMTKNCICLDIITIKCPEGFEAIGGSCFHFLYDLDYRKNYTIAKTACRDIHPNAELAILDDCNLFREVVDFLIKREEIYSGVSFWLNAYQKIDGNYYWGNKKKLNLGAPFWGSGIGFSQGYGNVDKCVILWAPNHYYLHDHYCPLEDNFPLCQVDPIP